MLQCELHTAAKVFQRPSMLHKRRVYNFAKHTRAKSQLRLCIQMRASAALCTQNSLWMGARQNSVWLWLCQITTCLHGDKTWNSAALFACVSYRMHNASRAWIIYINKWRESVWCSAKPFLFYFHLKAVFFLFFCLFCTKKTNKTNLHIGETDGRQGETESPIQNHTVMEMEVAMEIRKWSNLLDSPERMWWSLGGLAQSRSHL